MTVVAINRSARWLSNSLTRLGFSEQSQIDVRLSVVYEVHAVVLWSGEVFYQIVGESGLISWLPAVAFEIQDRSLPDDWLFNSLDQEVPLIIGPAFITDSKEAYSEMVELDPDKVRQFRDRLNRRGIAST